MSKPLRRLSALRELRGLREWVEFAKICALAAIVPLVMRLPLQRLSRLITRRVGRRPPPDELVVRRAELVELAQRVGYPVIRGGCLPRGVTLYWLLRGDGLDVELCFGIDPLGVEVDGHCWLSLDGEPLLERTDPRTRFSETFRMPAAAG